MYQNFIPLNLESQIFLAGRIKKKNPRPTPHNTDTRIKAICNAV